MTDVNRCPFCGSVAFYTMNDEDGETRWTVCDNCGASGSPQFIPADIDPEDYETYFDDDLIHAFTHPAHIRALADDEIAIKRGMGETLQRLGDVAASHDATYALYSAAKDAFANLTRALEALEATPTVHVIDSEVCK